MSFVNSTTFAMAGPGNTNSASTSTSTDAGLIGLGFNLPDFTQKSPVVAAGSNYNGSAYPAPIQRPTKPLVGLGLELPTADEETVQPTIGLGIYTSGREVVDDREEEDKLSPSPPLLPTRRGSSSRITVVVDDDEFPPTHNIFTRSPHDPESPETKMTCPYRRPLFMSAPSASELPLPRGYTHLANVKRDVEQEVDEDQSSDETDRPTIIASSTATSIYSGASEMKGDYEAEAENVTEPLTHINTGSPRTPFVFQPFSPLAEDRPVEYMDAPVLLRAPAFMQYGPDVFSPARVSSAEADAEAYFHLPSDLLDSPTSVVQSPLICGGFETIYQTPVWY